MQSQNFQEMNRQIEEKVVRRTLEQIILKHGEPALSLYGDHTFWARVC